MFAPSELSPRVRNFAAALVHRSWAWISAVGLIGPDDIRARRFATFGPRSGIAFPPGPMYGEDRIRIGARTLIGPNVTLAVGIGPDDPLIPGGDAVIVIGDGCNIGRNSSIVGLHRIEIGDDVTTGPNVYVTDHNHRYDDTTAPISRQWPAHDPVSIGAGSWLGAGVVVLPGAKIGRNVAVAAASVVRGEIPDFSVAAGAPARVVRRWDAGAGWTPPIREQAGEPPPGW